MRYVHLVLLLAVPGCTFGRNFSRPTAEDLRLGETREAEVIARYGAPQSTSVVRNDVAEMRQLTYTFLYLGRIDRTKMLQLWFCDDRLVGKSFSSFVPDEQPEFDQDKVARVKEGITTRQEVLALFGEPSGEYVHPMTRGRDERTLQYVRFELRWSGRDDRVVHGNATAVFRVEGDVVREKSFLVSHRQEGP